MVRAISGSADLKPNATRVMSLVLVLVDSMSVLERPCSIAARIRSGLVQGLVTPDVSARGCVLEG